MRGRATLAAIVLCGGVAAGCGSSSSDQHDASVASQAVQQALAQQRQQQEDAAQKAKLRKLQRKLAHEKGQDAQKAASAAAGGSGGSGSQQGGGGAAGNGGGGPHGCGSGVTAQQRRHDLLVRAQRRGAVPRQRRRQHDRGLQPGDQADLHDVLRRRLGHHLHRRQQRVGDIQLTRALVALAAATLVAAGCGGQHEQKPASTAAGQAKRTAERARRAHRIDRLERQRFMTALAGRCVGLARCQRLPARPHGPRELRHLAPGLSRRARAVEGRLGPGPRRRLPRAPDGRSSSPAAAA